MLKAGPLNFDSEKKKTKIKFGNGSVQFFLIRLTVEAKFRCSRSPTGKTDCNL